MRIMFMGTPDFAGVCLKSLIDGGHDIVSVITTPDKPRGRGHKLSPTPVGELADKMGLKVYKPINLKKENFEDILKSENPDIIIVVAYGRLLGEYILNFPKYGCVNVHASLLPKYRGAAPIQRAIINGDKVSGVTTMYMEKGLDTGDMLLKSEVEILPCDNFETLHDKLASSGAALILETIKKIEDGSIVREKQDDTKSTYAHMITKETALINWQMKAVEIHNLVRGLYPVPKAFTKYGDKQMKICISKVLDMKTSLPGGQIIEVTPDFISIACGDGTVLAVSSIQMEGKREMAVFEYLKGNSIDSGLVLGG